MIKIFKDFKSLIMYYTKNYTNFLKLICYFYIMKFENFLLRIQ